MPGAIEVRISPNFVRWEQGFADLPGAAARAAFRAWDDAARSFYGLSQEYVHVVSGDLKRSGSFKTRADRDGLVAAVTYDSDHAIYEEMRGGPHAFLGRAWEQSEAAFNDVFGGAWQEVVASWR
jgi:hypothetical protein